MFRPRIAAEFFGIVILAASLPLLFIAERMATVTWRWFPTLSATPQLAWSSIPGWILNGVAHIGGMHLLINMIGLLGFGLAAAIAGARFTFILAPLVASFTGDLQMIAADHNARGLSGGISFLMGLAIVTNLPRFKAGWISLIDELSAPFLGAKSSQFAQHPPVLRIGFALYLLMALMIAYQILSDVLGLLNFEARGLLANPAGQNTGYIAHLSGFSIGLVAGKLNQSDAEVSRSP